MNDCTDRDQWPVPLKQPAEDDYTDHVPERDYKERSVSPVRSCVSMVSDWSMDNPPKLCEGSSQNDPSPVHQERSESPAPSCVSVKSAWSMDNPPKLQERDKPPEQSILQERSRSPVPSCASMQSDSSMEHPVTFTDKADAADQSRIHQATSGLCVPSCESENVEQSVDLSEGDARQKCEPKFSEEELQRKLKSTLKTKFQCLCEGIAKEGKHTLLNEIYTELYITEGGSEDVNNEHEVRQIETASRRTATEDTPIKCNDIFKPLLRQDKPIRTVLTTGVAGIGKTVSVQKFILDWAEGKANQDIHFIFPLPFRELNLMKDQKRSLVDLLSSFVMAINESDFFSRHKILFIFDGLDECRLPLDFQNNKSLSDVTVSVSVDVLLTNLIKGNLLPSALIWITSRPAAASQIPPQHVDQVTEIRGFNDPQKEEYFRKRISDEHLAENVISHLRSLRSLYIMCHIPVFCWISATVLEKMLAEAKSGEIPTTLTQMYTHFLIIQTKIIEGKYTERKTPDGEMIFKLGKLAFQQLEKGNLIFYEEDLRKCGINVKDASVYSGLCTQIFREELGLYHGKVYCFVHLSIQEHLAALYVYLDFNNGNRNVLDQPRIGRLAANFKCSTISDLHKKAVDKALQSKNGHLDLFLRFLLGISLEANQQLLKCLPTQAASSSFCTEETIDYIKTRIRMNSSPEKSINLFHCLNELNDKSLVEEIQNYQSSGRLLKVKLSHVQWSALVFVLLTSEKEIDEFDLRKYSIQNYEQCLLKLMPVVKTCRTAELSSCNLTEKGFAALASMISSKSSCLRKIDLSENTLGDSGLDKLSLGFRNSHCKLEILNLSQCGITSCGSRILASALKSNPSHLKELDLSFNDLQNQGIETLSRTLKDPSCKLEKLRLVRCMLTKTSCSSLASIFHSNSNLKELDLENNDLQDIGVDRLSAGLRSPCCKLEILNLSGCGIREEGFATLASALMSNPFHLRELNMNMNRVGDLGVKRFSALLKESSCKLEKLRLSSCGVTDESCASLARALQSNPSHLRELDLHLNQHTDCGKKLLSSLQEHPDFRLEKLKI